METGSERGGERGQRVGGPGPSIVITFVPPALGSTSAETVFHGGGVHHRVMRAGSVLQRKSFSREASMSRVTTSSWTVGCMGVAEVMDISGDRE